MEVNGLVLKGIGGFYYVETTNSVIECKAVGKFRNKNISPYPGDRVRVSVDDNGQGTIIEIEERKNFFQRPTIANIDQLFIVVSASQPVPNVLNIDKMLSIAEYKGIKSYLVFTKTDLASAKELMQLYKSAGFGVFEISKEDQKQAQDILPLFKGKISALCGNSGVGKSTLLNELFPDLDLKTSHISQKLGRGRHTTRQTELYSAAGGYVADTPGFSTVDISRYEIILKDDLADTFPEFREYADDCMFTGCSHVKEKGCAVVQAVAEGKIAQSRHESYCALYEDAKKIKEWELK